jgi:Flp pilus assembly pilin Flp
LAGRTATFTILVTTSLGTENDPVTDFGDLPPVRNVRGVVETSSKEKEPVAKLLQSFWSDESGQDIAEYAVMLAVILVIVVGTIRLIGSNANNVFSNVGSAIQ